MKKKIVIFRNGVASFAVWRWCR